MWIGGVRVIIPDENGRILMVKQEHPERCVWMVPGGGIEEGESSPEAAVREVKEETGIDIEIDRMLWYVEENSDRGQRFVNFFLAKPTDKDPVLGYDPEFDEEHQVMTKLEFLSRNQVMKLEAVYPEFMKEEFWTLMEKGKPGYNAYKVRDNNPVTK